MLEYISFFRFKSRVFIKQYYLLILGLLPCFISYSQNQNIKVEKIWDQAPHNAFTDLIRYHGRFYCVFRESIGHVPRSRDADGKIRILESKDGNKWDSFALIEKEGYDLRDPSLSITSRDELMVLMGGSVYEEGKLLSMNCQVSFFNNSTAKFSDPQPIKFDFNINSDKNWLWRIKWNNNVAYGVVYYSGPNGAPVISLVTSSNGIDYSLVKSFDTDGKPNETALSFMPDGELIILVRREGEGKLGLNGLLGRSKYPYQDWEWADVGFRLGGPNLITTTKGQFIIGTRIYSKNGSHTGLLCNDSAGKFRQFIELPSGGDTSYTGLIIFKNKLFVSYYSSHEGKTSIYLTKIPMKEINRLIGNDVKSPFSRGNFSQ